MAFPYLPLKGPTETSEIPVQSPATPLNRNHEQDTLGLEPNDCNQSDLQTSLSFYGSKVHETCDEIMAFDSNEVI